MPEQVQQVDCVAQTLVNGGENNGAEVQQVPAEELQEVDQTYQTGMARFLHKWPNYVCKVPLK